MWRSRSLLYPSDVYKEGSGGKLMNPSLVAELHSNGLCKRIGNRLKLINS
jgi:hypothetical protein